VMGVTIFVIAPLLVSALLGPGFGNAVLVLRILSLLPPLAALSNVFGIQWMLALGMDRLFTAVIVAACALNVALAIILVPHYLQVGMAVAVIASETLVAFGMYATLRIKHLDPLVIARDPGQPDPTPSTVGVGVHS
jgi:PST family polysaccharide transporter